MKKRVGILSAVCIFLMLCMGYSQSSAHEQSEIASVKKENTTTKVTASEEKGSRPWKAVVLVPDASGTEVYEEGEVSLDVSNTSKGYVMLKYNGSNPKVKFQITTPEKVTYTYLVTEYGNYMTYPLPEGDGTYGFTVYEAASIEKNLYAAVMTKEVVVSISDEFQTFLYPNCYVDFDASSACVKKGEELAKGSNTDLDVVASIYDYVINNITYDYDKAATVQTGYAPYPDDTLASGTGICFDYASLMSAMLRAQQIPTRLEVGYVGDLYHAWLSCFIDEKGWVDKIIEFNGKSWTMMDPTMAAGSGSKEVLKLQEETGYIVKYVY